MDLSFRQNLGFLMLWAVTLMAGACSDSPQDSRERNVQAHDSVKLVQSTIGSAIQRIQVNGEDTIEYCPDNTCDVFRAGKSSPEIVLWDFSVLYLAYVSRYYSLDPVRPNLRQYSAQLLNKYGSECVGTSGKNRVDCVLKNMADKYDIKIYTVGYDEGQRNEDPRTLEDALRLGPEIK